MTRIAPTTTAGRVEVHPARSDWLGIQTRITNVYGERCFAAMQRFSEAAKTQGRLRRTPDPGGTLLDLWRDASPPARLGQRSILFWDTLRQRGNNWIEHEKAGKPPLLHFEWEMIADARGFERPELRPRAHHSSRGGRNRIGPPAVRHRPARRPWPGHRRLQAGLPGRRCTKAGHPGLLRDLLPEPVPGRRWPTSRRRRVEFLRIIAARHPKTRKPVVIGNCQGGWACMLVGAFEPDLGPIVINGAPMSYWAGNDGENPMRYAGGMLGGLWPAPRQRPRRRAVRWREPRRQLREPQPGQHVLRQLTRFSPRSTPSRSASWSSSAGGAASSSWTGRRSSGSSKTCSSETSSRPARRNGLKGGRSISVPSARRSSCSPARRQHHPAAAGLQLGRGHLSDHRGPEGERAGDRRPAQERRPSRIFVSGQVAKREHTQIVDVLDYIEHLPPGLRDGDRADGNGRQHALRRGPDRAARRGPAGPAEIRAGRTRCRSRRSRRLRLPRLSLRDAGASRACFCGHP